MFGLLLKQQQGCLLNHRTVWNSCTKSQFSIEITVTAETPVDFFSFVSDGVSTDGMNERHHSKDVWSKLCLMYAYLLWQKYLQELTASVNIFLFEKKNIVFFFFLSFVLYLFFFKLISLGEEEKIVILCSSTIFQLVFSYNLYFIEVKKNALKAKCFCFCFYKGEKAGAF